MEARETYQGTRSDHFTHSHDLPPQLGGCGMTPEGEPFAAAIDGQAPGAWCLPLEPLSGDERIPSRLSSLCGLLRRVSLADECERWSATLGHTQSGPWKRGAPGTTQRGTVPRQLRGWWATTRL